MARPRNPAAPLKEKLATVAHELIREHGVEGLTVRTAAAAANVSANAPYFHFPGGARELIAAAAIGGFTELRDALGRLPHRESAVEQVRDVVQCYVAFGVQNAELYRAMFHQQLAEPLEAGSTPEQGENTYARLRKLKDRAYDDIVAPLARLSLEGSLNGRDPRGAVGLALAAIAHGLVGVFIDEGLLRPPKGEGPWTEDRQAMAVEVTDVLLLGLLRHSPGVSTEMEAPAPLAPENDPSWRQYGQTILEFFPGEQPVSIDLRKAPVAGAVGRLHERGLPFSFAVLTACNPRGRTTTESENRQRTADLRGRLRESGQLWVPADGVSPDGRHREAGIAVAMSQEAARDLARDFEQSALFWYDGAAFWLVGALVQVPPVRLPASTPPRMSAS